MTHDLEALFRELIDLDEAARGEWLERQGLTQDERDSLLDRLGRYQQMVDRLSFVADQRFPIEVEEPGSDWVGRTLDDYTILEEVGRGGMGVVFRAREGLLDREVALKVLLSSFSSSEPRVERFRQEARAIAGLDHPSIVPVYRTGESDGVHFLAMRFVDGASLRDVIDGERERGTRSPEERTRWHRRVATLIAAVADAVEYAHKKQIVHRDLKPSNILADAEDRPLVADFGLAMRLDDEVSNGPLAGTVRYMSPEQAQASGVKVDERSDVFSLGATLYEALSLQVAFHGETTAQIRKAVLTTTPPPIRSRDASIPKDLEVVCSKALEHDPDLRYQRIEQLAADLRCFLEGRPILAQPPSIVRRARHFLKRHRVACLATLVLLLGSVVAGQVIRTRSERASRLSEVVLDVPGDAELLLLTFLPGSDEHDPAQHVGRGPTSIRIEPGRYRVVAYRSDGAFAEADLRCFRGGASRTLELVPTTRPSGMVRVPGGTYRLGRDDLSTPYQRQREIELVDFWIDPTEVTNAEYREFREATGAALPLMWIDPPTESFLARPVVLLTPMQMEAFARWAGKRLPTAAEWEAAWLAGGGRFLWGAELEERWPNIASEDRLLHGLIPADARRAAYLRNVQPSRSVPELSTSSGLFHLAGNVREATSSWLLDMGEVWIVKGGSWRTSPPEVHPALSYTRPGNVGSQTLGFRCVRTDSIDHLLVDH